MIASGERMDFSGARPARPPTSTPPAASATRSRCRSRRWSPPAASRCRSCPAAGSATPAARSTSSSRSPAGGPTLTQRGDARASSRDVGAVICAAGDGLAPADKKLYALRDVTGTVEAIPLIASSIMSKKIAEGTGALVLDVKVGSGAFMKDLERRPRAGRARWSRSAPTPACSTVALLTDMSTPLGLTAGNALEVARVGRGARRRRPGRRRRADPGAGPRDARRGRPRPTSTRPTRSPTGSAMDVWRRMIRAQGGDPDAPLPDGARDARRHGAGATAC